jgi:hypothetical protein
MEEKLTFSSIIEQSILDVNVGAHITFIDVITVLFITFFCALIIAWIYRRTYSGILYQRSFATTIILASLVTSSIIMVISGNLILSLGMVGALSIVRFRAAIKDPLDIVFMFWAISVGIANGVAYFKVSIISTIVLSMIMLVMKNEGFSKRVSHLLVLKLEGKSENEVLDIMKKYTKKYRLKSKFVKSGNYEIVYEIHSANQMELMNRLDALNGVLDVSLV